MNEHLCWAAAMLGTGMVTKLQEMLFLLSRNCTGKWDGKYMREQNSWKTWSRSQQMQPVNLQQGAFTNVKYQRSPLNFSKANKFALAFIEPCEPYLHRC